MTAKQYREQIYRLRAHPQPETFEIGNRKGSLLLLYVSLLPFLFVEYVAESKELFPSGLVFPVGFVLFWAFFFTYYRPHYLEDKLSAPAQWNIFALPAILLGTLIWLVKVLLGGMIHTLLFRWLFGKRPKEQQRMQYSYDSAGDSRAYRPASTSRPNPSPIFQLPPDVRASLEVLGLKGCRNWSLIHQRYREMAKKVHPDLNPEITSVGNRFIRLDAAYKKLVSVRERYFSEKKLGG